MLCPLLGTHSKHICLVKLSLGPLLGDLTLETDLVEVCRLGHGVVIDIFLLLGLAQFKSSCSGIQFRRSFAWLAEFVFGAIVFRQLLSLPVCAGLIVASEVAVLAEAFAVVGLASVRAQPRLLGAASAMVAIDAHALRVVASVLVRAVHNLPLAEVVGSRDTWHLVALILGLISGLSIAFGSILLLHLQVRIAIEYYFSNWHIFHGELLRRACHLGLAKSGLFFRSFIRYLGDRALLGLSGPLLALRRSECALV